MQKLLTVDILRQPGRSVTWGANEEAASDALEVNVIFTEPKATAAALIAANSFARGLGASICLRAAIVVPLRLPLGQPPISVPFFARVLRDLVAQPELDGMERTIHLYVCRDWIKSLLQLLRPNALVVIGGRERWWPTTTSRVVRALRARNNRVLFVDVTKRPAGSLR